MPFFDYLQPQLQRPDPDFLAFMDELNAQIFPGGPDQLRDELEQISPLLNLPLTDDLLGLFT